MNTRQIRWPGSGTISRLPGDAAIRTAGTSCRTELWFFIPMMQIMFWHTTSWQGVMMIRTGREICTQVWPYRPENFPRCCFTRSVPQIYVYDIIFLRVSTWKKSGEVIRLYLLCTYPVSLGGNHQGFFFAEFRLRGSNQPPKEAAFCFIALVFYTSDADLWLVSCISIQYDITICYTPPLSYGVPIPDQRTSHGMKP